MPKIYLVKLFNDVESFYKIGFTKYKNTIDRFTNIPYEFCLLETIIAKDETDAFIAEQTILEDFSIRHSKYKPKNRFSGDSECFLGIDDESIKLEFIKTVSRLYKFDKSKKLIFENKNSLKNEYNNDYTKTIQLNKFASEFLRKTNFSKISSIEEINEYTNFVIQETKKSYVLQDKKTKKKKKFNIYTDI